MGCNINYPSGRKSYQDNLTFSNWIKMGKYSLNSSPNKDPNKNRPSGSNDRGIDETDNIMSKMYQKDCMIGLSHLREPAIPPERCESSHANRSQSQENSAEDTSDSSDNENSRSYVNHSDSVVDKSSSNNGNSSNYLFILSILVGIIGIVFLVAYGKLWKRTPAFLYTEVMFENDMNSLGLKYNIDTDNMLRMKTALKSIVKKEDAASFIFLYNDRNGNFDEFINSIAGVSSKFLRNDSSSVRHFIVENSDLDMINHNELVHKYKSTVTDRGVMVIKQLEDIPSKLAMAFHYYCDEYNPLVQKSAIFFALDISKCPTVEENDKSSVVDKIEKCLHEKWSNLPNHNLRPLLNRIINVVVDVTNVF